MDWLRSEQFLLGVALLYMLICVGVSVCVSVYVCMYVFMYCAWSY